MTEAPASPRKSKSGRIRLDALTGIRAILAWWVALAHLEAEPFHGLFGENLFTEIIRGGEMRVHGFFMLSGFVLQLVYMRQFSSPVDGRGWTRFQLARVARLYPAHLLALLLMLAMVLSAMFIVGAPMKNPERFSPEMFAANLLFIQGWGFHSSWNYPSWAVSVEMLACLFFPFLSLQLTRNKSTPWRAVAVCFTLVSLCHLARSLPAEYLGPEHRYFWMAAAITEFALGASLYTAFGRWAIEHPARGVSRWYGLMLVGCFFGGVLVVLNFTGKSGQFLTVLVFSFLVVQLARDGDLFGGFLATKPMVALGNASYGVFLFHALAQGAGIAISGSVPRLWNALPRPVWFILVVVSLQIAALLLYRYFEVPIRDRLRDVIDAKLPAREASGVRVAAAGD